ncbi:MAG TPA: hypothetical protein VGP24_03875 [Glaciihabitans sp.]|jgi:hypothetical protein|nr:hypothetical protein [Glaciihabitans sp.]
MFGLSFTLWTAAIVVMLVAIALTLVSARIKTPVLGAAAASPVLVGLLAYALGFDVAPPHPVYASLVALGIGALGATAGSPLTLFILGLAEKNSVRTGLHGGIFTVTSAEDATVRVQKEVLRGGATIGYLERIAVLGCIVSGQFEGLAVIVAIKGLGRFSELDSPEARERFIIGTLVSITWACAAGALIMLTI